MTVVTAGYRTVQHHVNMATYCTFSTLMLMAYSWQKLLL